MMKSMAHYTLLLVMVAGSAHAGIYRCEDADGAVFFTDNPTTAPLDCRVEVVKDLPLMGVLPGSASSEASSVSQSSQAIQASPQAEPDTAEDPFDSLKEKATDLAAQYENARSRVFRSTLAKNRQNGMRELKTVRAEKGRLLSAVYQASISSSQKKELEGILSSIDE